MLMIPPNVTNGAIDGIITATLFYTYMDQTAKTAVDQEILSKFSRNYLWSRFDGSCSRILHFSITKHARSPKSS